MIYFLTKIIMSLIKEKLYTSSLTATKLFSGKMGFLT